MAPSAASESEQIIMPLFIRIHQGEVGKHSLDRELGEVMKKVQSSADSTRVA